NPIDGILAPTYAYKKEDSKITVEDTKPTYASKILLLQYRIAKKVAKDIGMDICDYPQKIVLRNVINKEAVNIFKDHVGKGQTMTFEKDTLVSSEFMGGRLGKAVSHGLSDELP